MKKETSISNGRVYFLKVVEVKDLMNLKPVKTASGVTLKDTSTKSKYTNPAIATLCDFIISKGYGDVVIQVEGVGGQDKAFINRGSTSEILTNIVIDILSSNIRNGLTGKVYTKAQDKGVDLDISMLPYETRKSLGLTCDKGLIELKYSNSNTKANACKSTVDSVLLLTPNGFSIVKRDKLIIDKKTKKIFASSEINGRKCKKLNEIVGF